MGTALVLLKAKLAETLVLVGTVRLRLEVVTYG